MLKSKTISHRAQLELSETELSKLSDLDVCQCGMTSLPESLSRAMKLRTLCIRKCSALMSLPRELGQLRLQELRISGCHALASLPESLGDLPELRLLEFGQSLALTYLPRTLGRARALQTLALYHCKALECLPKSLGGLAALNELKINSCPELESLPESLGRLKELRVLSLAGCAALTRLPESLDRLSGLREMNLRGCISLTCLPESLGLLKELRVLNLDDCALLARLPESMSALALSALSTVGCKKLPRMSPAYSWRRALPDMPPGHAPHKSRGECTWTAAEHQRAFIYNPRVRILALVLATRRVSRQRQLRLRLSSELLELVFKEVMAVRWR